jgi:hypothetical protein
MLPELQPNGLHSILILAVTFSLEPDRIIDSNNVAASGMPTG